MYEPDAACNSKALESCSNEENGANSEETGTNGEENGANGEENGTNGEENGATGEENGASREDAKMQKTLMVIKQLEGLNYVVKRRKKLAEELENRANSDQSIVGDLSSSGALPACTTVISLHYTPDQLAGAASLLLYPLVAHDSWVGSSLF